MKPSSCLHPIRIYSKSLGSYIHVPCGHCEACNVIKGIRRTEKVNAAFNQFHYRYFLTLTYRNECLPLAKYDSVTDCYVSNDCDYNGECYHVSARSIECYASGEFINNCLDRYGGIPVLSHSDLIGFKKRLRYFLHEKIGYYPALWLFSVGEYGATYYRPHYHLCVGFDDKRVSSVFRECVANAWRMYDKYSSQTDLRLIGKIDIQTVVGKGCANYCASYLNCTTTLPKVLGSTSFRPFSTKSPCSSYELCRTGCDDIRKIYHSLPITQTFIDASSNELVTTLCSDLYRNRYFPKCAHFGVLSHWSRVQLYRVFEKFSSVSFDIAKQRFSADLFAQFFIENRRKNFYSPTAVELLIDSYFVGTDYFQSITKLKRLFYVSKRVCENSRALGVSVEDYVTHIERFYDKIELDKLGRFYQSINDLMNDPYNPVSLSNIFNLYFNTSDSIVNFSYYQKQFGVSGRSFDCSEIPQQIEYTSKMYKISLDNTKTKKRNDEFQNEGKKKLPYFFIPSRNKQKIINYHL